MLCTLTRRVRSYALMATLAAGVAAPLPALAGDRVFLRLGDDDGFRLVIGHRHARAHAYGRFWSWWPEPHRDRHYRHARMPLDDRELRLIEKRTRLIEKAEKAFERERYARARRYYRKAAARDEQRIEYRAERLEQRRHAAHRHGPQGRH